MKPLAWLLLGLLLVLDTASHLLLKASTSRAEGDTHAAFLRALLVDPMFWLAIATFLTMFVAWVGFLSLVPLSQGVMTGSITIAGVMIGGWLCFGERVTPARAAAAALIALGVVLVGWEAA
jgi:drug/metabolite transporter (DMT)-like permease